MIRLGTKRGDAGMVTAELAAALPVLALLVLAGLSAVQVVDARVRCLDAAREAVRAAARGDTDAVAIGRSVAPSGASVSISSVSISAGGAQVRASVTVVVHPLSSLLPGVTVRAEAVAAREPTAEARVDPIAQPATAPRAPPQAAGCVARCPPGAHTAPVRRR